MNNPPRHQRGNIGIIIAIIGILAGLVMIWMGLDFSLFGNGGPREPGFPPSGGDTSSRPLPAPEPSQEPRAETSQPSQPPHRADQVIVDLSELPPKVRPGQLGLPRSLTRDSVKQWMSNLPTGVKEVRLIIGGKTTRADITYFEDAEKVTGIRVIR